VIVGLSAHRPDADAAGAMAESPVQPGAKSDPEPSRVYCWTICCTSRNMGGSMYRSLTMFRSICSFHERVMAAE